MKHTLIKKIYYWTISNMKFLNLTIAYKRPKKFKNSIKLEVFEKLEFEVRRVKWGYLNWKISSKNSLKKNCLIQKFILFKMRIIPNYLSIKKLKILITKGLVNIFTTWL